VKGEIHLAPTDAALGGGGFVDAPRSLDVERCWQFHSDRDASCAGSPGTDESTEPVPTSAGRNAPLYYALVGAPLALSPDWIGVIAARLLGALVCALLLATALADARRWSRHGLMVAGVLAGTTPMVMHLAGSVNPSALELAASVALFAAAVPLLLHPAARRDTTLLTHAGIAAVVLATTRMLGPLWLAIAVLVLLPWRRAKLRDLWAWRALRLWVGGMIAAGLVGALWTLLSKGAASNPYFQQSAPMSPARIAWNELQTWRRYVDEMVGVFSWLDARMPELGYLIWPTIGGALVFWGYVVADRAGRRRLVALAAAGILAPMSISVALANTFGMITQGRYLLPLLIGLPILATYLTGEDGLSARRAGSVRRLSALALLPIQFAALASAMQRWQLGQGVSAGFDLLKAPWQPPLGPVLPLAVGAIGLALLGLVAAQRDPEGASSRRRYLLARFSRSARPGTHRATATGAADGTTAASR
jgi:hypothetical protein